MMALRVAMLFASLYMSMARWLSSLSCKLWGPLTLPILFANSSMVSFLHEHPQLRNKSVKGSELPAAITRNMQHLQIWGKRFRELSKTRVVQIFLGMKRQTELGAGLVGSQYLRQPFLLDQTPVPLPQIHCPRKPRPKKS